MKTQIKLTAGQDIVVYQTPVNKQAIGTLALRLPIDSQTDTLMVHIVPSTLPKKVVETVVTNSGAGYTALPAVSDNGANTATYAPRMIPLTWNITAGGSGYVIGQEILQNGATFRVTAVSSGAVTGLTYVSGVLSAMAGGATTTTAAAGTGLTVAVQTAKIAAVAVISSGAGYTGQANLVFSTSGSTTAATGYTVMSVFPAPTDEYLLERTRLVRGQQVEITGIALTPGDALCVMSRNGTVNSIFNYVEETYA